LLSQDEQRHRFAADLSDAIHTLRNHGKKVVVSLPFPIFNESIPQLAISNRVFGKFGLSQVPKEVSSPSFREEIRASAVRAGAEIFDPRMTLCPNGQCMTEKNGVSIYKDDSHIAGSQIHILESSLRDVLERSLAEQTLAPQNAPSQ
jgi:hypothetical protein